MHNFDGTCTHPNLYFSSQFLSNGQLLSPETFPWQHVFDDILGDKRKLQETSQLPQTGMGDETERSLSSCFVEPFEFRGSLYGTRSQTVIVGWQDGKFEVKERTSSQYSDHLASTVEKQFMAQNSLP